MPPHNIFVSSDRFRIEVPVAGFDESEIDVSTEDNVLTVKVGKNGEDASKEKDQVQGETEMCYRRGFEQNPFTLYFYLPMTHRPDNNVNVQLENGMLTIFIYRSSEYKRRSIPIKTVRESIPTDPSSQKQVE